LADEIALGGVSGAVERDKVGATDAESHAVTVYAGGDLGARDEVLDISFSVWSWKCQTGGEEAEQDGGFEIEEHCSDCWLWL
jgi:hypothetical protein